jgi:hypothetical protein
MRDDDADQYGVDLDGDDLDHVDTFATAATILTWPSYWTTHRSGRSSGSWRRSTASTNSSVGGDRLGCRHGHARMSHSWTKDYLPRVDIAAVYGTPASVKEPT